MSSHEAALIQAIDAGRCVAFVGAGLSLPVTGGWTDLLRGVAKTVNDADVLGRVESLLSGRPDNVDFEAAAQLLEAACSHKRGLGPLVADYLRVTRTRAAHSDIERVQSRLKSLRRIPFRAILTTNFDEFLEGEAPGNRVYREVLRDEQSRYARGPASGRVPVINLHGRLEDPDSIVMTRRAYRKRLHGDLGYLRFLSTILSTQTVLYIGFSFTDAYVNELRSEVLSMLGDDTGRPTSYAMLCDAGEARRHFLERYEGIGVIPYSADNDFADFDALLERLADETQPGARLGRLSRGRAILWMDPNVQGNRTASRYMGEGLVTCNTVADALVQLQQHDFDLVLTRFGYRGDQSDAEDLLAGMTRPARGAPVVVFAAPVTEQYAEQNKRRLLRAGAVAYTTSWDQLFEAVEGVLI